MQSIQQDCIGSYKMFGTYKVYTNGLVFNTDTNRMIGFKSNSKNPRKKIIIENVGSLDVGKIVAWLFILDEDPDANAEDIDIEYKDGDVMNCAVENIIVKPAVGRPPKEVYLVKKGSLNYEEYSLRELAKKLGRSVSWITTHLNDGEFFIWNDGLYTIWDDIFMTWDGL